jgi:hypothetical protein
METIVLGFNRVSVLHVPLPMHHHIQDLGVPNWDNGIRLHGRYEDAV